MNVNIQDKSHEALKEEIFILKTILELVGEGKLFKDSIEAFAEMNWNLVNECYEQNLTQYEAAKRIIESYVKVECNECKKKFRITKEKNTEYPQADCYDCYCKSMEKAIEEDFIAQEIENNRAKEPIIEALRDICEKHDGKIDKDDLIELFLENCEFNKITHLNWLDCSLLNKNIPLLDWAIWHLHENFPWDARKCFIKRCIQECIDKGVIVQEKEKLSYNGKKE